MERARHEYQTALFLDPGNDKAYRHPQFYKVPRGVRVF